jgi:poly(hydroxyalkanoate) depolymerase family esterase
VVSRPGGGRRATGLAIALIAGAAALAAVLTIPGHERRGAGGASGLHTFRFGHDAYRYALFVPPRRHPGSAMPLVVVLHGCTMTPAEEQAATGYDQLAAVRGFAVLYPDVDAADVANGRCWKALWDPPADGRGRGDAGAIAAMTTAVIARWHVDPTRVYAIGISAGAFEVSSLGAAYPDIYAAIGIHSGAGYHPGAYGCPAVSAGTTQTTARAAVDAMGPRARAMPVIIFHGDRDGTIPYRCGRQALAQWLAADDLVLRRQHNAPVPSTPSRSTHAAAAGRRAYAVLSYRERPGCPIAEFWSIHGMGHYWSGGSADPASLRYSDPTGPSATAASWTFFSRWQRSAGGSRCRD